MHSLGIGEEVDKVHNLIEGRQNDKINGLCNIYILSTLSTSIKVFLFCFVHVDPMQIQNDKL